MFYGLLESHEMITDIWLICNDKLQKCFCLLNIVCLCPSVRPSVRPSICLAAGSNSRTAECILNEFNSQ